MLNPLWKKWFYSVASTDWKNSQQTSFFTEIRHSNPRFVQKSSMQNKQKWQDSLCDEGGTDLDAFKCFEHKNGLLFRWAEKEKLCARKLTSGNNTNKLPFEQRAKGREGWRWLEKRKHGGESAGKDWRQLDRDKARHEKKEQVIRQHTRKRKNTATDANSNAGCCYRNQGRISQRWNWRSNWWSLFSYIHTRIGYEQQKRRTTSEQHTDKQTKK